MLQRIKEGIQNFIHTHIAADFDKSGHDPLCFDCNDGNDQCVYYPNCNHIQGQMEYYKALGIKFPGKEGQ